ncbi:hypothetical protein L0991_12310 [Vibrio chagasii]|uniref:hypothetical protein n=1 Tax=Vibrio chagasii TaxID=170679 RepID=UPI0035A5CAEC
MIYNLDYIKYLTDYDGTGSVILDLPNYLFLVVVAISMKYIYRVPWPYIIALILVSILPFFLNGLLFSPEYFPDQYRYWILSNDFRNLDTSNFGVATSVDTASILLSFIPIPTLFTISSLGFANRIIAVLLFVFLYRKGYLTSFSSWFFILYPSFLLYSSLSLRDTLILMLMFLSIVFLLERKILLYSICIVFLFLVKFQNAIILFLLGIFTLIFRLSDTGVSFKKFLFLFIVSVVILISISPFIIEPVNYYRQAMFIEDGGEGLVKPIASITDFILGLFSGTTKFLLMPTLFDAQGGMQLIQAVENLIVFSLMVVCFFRLVKNNVSRPFALYWLFFMICCCGIYGLVVFNFGTAARYRFPFVLIFVVMVCYEGKKNEKNYNRSELSQNNFNI